MSGPDGLRVGGGTGGVAARLEDLDRLATGLADAAAEAAVLAARSVAVLGDPVLLDVLVADPLLLGRVVAEAGEAAGSLCRGAGVLVGLAAGVAGAVAAYRAQEEALSALVRGVPLVTGAVARGRVTVLAALPLPGGAPGAGLLALLPEVLGAGAAVLGAGAAVLGSREGAAGPRAAAVRAVVDHPDVVDAVVRLLPGLLGARDVPALARAAGTAGQVSGRVVETGVVAQAGTEAACTDPGPSGGPGRAAGGVADLLRRGQGVAAWRVPRPGEHDSLPTDQPRPVPGQVRVDRVEQADGAVAWVVHVPGTQDWDGDGAGSPMDMAANLALVGGRRSAVAEGVAGALLGAGARRGEPVLLVGHSQGGMTALDLAADPGLRRVVSVTHVVSAGSPLAGRTPPPGVQVLALEHDDDLVPRLDGRTHPDRRDRVVVRRPAPEGPWRTDAVPAHSSSAYVVTAAAVDASAHPSLVSFRAGLSPFLDRPGASCRSRQVVLARAPGGRR